MRDSGANAGGLRANDERDGEHAGEGDEVFVFGDLQRQVRRHAEEIEGSDAKEGGHDGGATAGAGGYGDYAQEINHGQVGGS